MKSFKEKERLYLPVSTLGLQVTWLPHRVARSQAQPPSPCSEAWAPWLRAISGASPSLSCPTWGSHGVKRNTPICRRGSWGSGPGRQVPHTTKGGSYRPRLLPGLCRPHCSCQEGTGSSWVRTGATPFGESCKRRLCLPLFVDPGAHSSSTVSRVGGL